MAINTSQELFQHDVKDIYDAEHQFLKGQEEMLASATDSTLKQMITKHISQTQQHIRNLDQVFTLLGIPSERVMCDGAKGLVSEAQKGIKETSGVPAVCDLAIAGAADKVEHYEIASYRGLIGGAQMMGQRDIVDLLQQNLQQEEETSKLLEQAEPQLLKKAMSGATQSQGDYTQSNPS